MPVACLCSPGGVLCVCLCPIFLLSTSTPAIGLGSCWSGHTHLHGITPAHAHQPGWTGFWGAATPTGSLACSCSQGKTPEASVESVSLKKQRWDPGARGPAAWQGKKCLQGGRGPVDPLSLVTVAAEVTGRISGAGQAGVGHRSGGQRVVAWLSHGNGVLRSLGA